MTDHPSWVIDEGVQSVQGFVTFLRQHRLLFAALGRVEVIYAAAEPQWFARAGATFRKMFGAENPMLPLDPEVLEMVDYFEARRKMEPASIAD